jgi:hypothetical protein
MKQSAQIVQNESNLIMNNTNSSLQGTEGSRMVKVNSGEELRRNEALLEAEAAGAEPSSHDSDDSTERLMMIEEISDLNPHDVLLGRGTGPSDYIGNRVCVSSSNPFGLNRLTMLRVLTYIHVFLLILTYVLGLSCAM